MSIDVPAADRPVMPSGYGIDRDRPPGLTWGWVAERLAASRNYWVAATRPGGAPHVAPVWGVWHDGSVWFGSDPSSAKGRAIAHDHRVVVHLESGDEAVIVEGVAELAPLPDGARAKYRDKYVDPETGDPFDPGGGDAYRVRPVKVLAWLEHDFVASASRWVFREA
jgi:hypothetical protein